MTAVPSATLPLFLLLALNPGPGDNPTPEAVEFFEKQVRPVLAEHCYSCHGPQKQKGGLRLDSRAAVLRGTDEGPVVKPGEPDQSSLIRAVRHAGEVKMPPKGKLPEAAVSALTAWVKMGVPWPASDGRPSEADAAKTHWAFQPVRAPRIPTVRGSWCRTPVDVFLLAKLEAAGLAPAPEADRATLLRRLTFDLHGLPPTPEELAAFLADDRPDAYERVVERLLASPRYGERWGRFWLDVARYADSKGYVFTEERRYPFAYTYRDWVIRAFNEDLPYDQFLTQQIAGDHLATDQDQRPLAALGFLTLGRRFLNNQHDIIDDRIDVVTRGTLGLTVTCARCHDHKFDPISMRDYYGLHGVFASSAEPKDLPLLTRDPMHPAARDYEAKLEQLQAAVKKFEEDHKEELKARNQSVRDQFNRVKGKIDQLNATHPGAPPRAMALVDGPNPHNSRVLLRGNPGNPGPEAPRQFLGVLAGPKPQPFTQGSGRLELAKAIADPQNPLTARVFVNRVWLHHFGAGLVRTPSDFGLRGDPPTHPELLDFLASRFVAEGWSVKALHRLILRSAAYRQASDGAAEAYRKDPDNRLLARMNRRRLDFEALRDGLLAVAGGLDGAIGGPAADLVQPQNRRRTVYGYVDRQNLPGVFRTFDFANPDAHSPQRFATTVPQQALFLLNSPFVVEQARKLAASPDVTASADPVHRIGRLYGILYGRPPVAEEVALGLEYLNTAAAEGEKLSPWERYAQVLLLANGFAFVD